ncbi:MAG: TetR/AcrR family transcriptional regulator [Variibacter sp.]
MPKLPARERAVTKAISARPQPAKGSRGKRAAVRAAPKSRDAKSAATRAAIIDAALDEFAARGFAAARLDDVARRAGVAKGTIYVHFRDKETLFEELVRASLGPLLRGLEEAPVADVPLRVFVEGLLDHFVKEILGTRRKHVVRLIITEGGRFPSLAQIYYREVIKRALAVVRGAVGRAIARGEIEGDALRRFPQLLVAPGILALVWDMLFARFEPLDAGALMRAHLDLVFAAIGKGGK